MHLVVECEGLDDVCVDVEEYATVGETVAAALEAHQMDAPAAAYALRWGSADTLMEDAEAQLASYDVDLYAEAPRAVMVLRPWALAATLLERKGVKIAGSILTRAITRREWDDVRLLIQSGKLPKTARSAMHKAVVKNDAERVAKLLEYGVEPTAQHTNGTPVLATALLLGHNDIATMLAEAGASVTTRVKAGVVRCRALSLACAQGCYDVVARGLDVENAAPDSPSGPLSAAVREGHIAVVAKLLEHGADVNQRPKAGVQWTSRTWFTPDSPLEAAAKAGRYQATALLLEAGAAVTVAAVRMALEGAHHDVARQLLPGLAAQGRQHTTSTSTMVASNTPFATADAAIAALVDRCVADGDMAGLHVLVVDGGAALRPPLFRAALKQADVGMTRCLLQHGCCPIDTAGARHALLHHAVAAVADCTEADGGEGAEAAYQRFIDITKGFENILNAGVPERQRRQCHAAMMTALAASNNRRASGGDEALASAALGAVGSAAPPTARSGVEMRYHGTPLGAVLCLCHLIDAGCDVDAREHGGGGTVGASATALGVALAQPATYPSARVLLAAGADPNVADGHGVCGMGVLVAAAAKRFANLGAGQRAVAVAGAAAMAEVVLQYGGDARARDRHGAPVVVIAVQQGWCGFVELLLRHGADPRARIAGVSAITYAVSEGSAGCAGVLLRYGADASAVDEPEGWTPLLEAVDVESSELTRMLLEAGANPNAATSAGRTPLMHAVELEHAGLVRLLLAAGACVNPKDACGETALMLAAQSGRHDCVRLLLDAGADADSADAEGTTPLDLALQHGHGTVAAELMLP